VASLRSEARIQCSAATVWGVVSDAERIDEWFPGMLSATVADGVRTITLRSGMPLFEDVVNVDHRLRRFQYRITGPMPMAHHLGTIDVIDDGLPGCLLVYSTEIVPEPLAFVFDGAIASAVTTLAELLESGALVPRPPATDAVAVAVGGPTDQD
jgi:hypothetical protein